MSYRTSSFKHPRYQSPDSYPQVAVIMSVYNGEEFLRQKLHSILETPFPKDKLEIRVGSDGSTDRTNQILRELEEEYENLHINLFKDRQGKGAVLNQLVQEAEAPILVMTDISFLLERDTLPALVRHFRTPDIGIVGADVINDKEQSARYSPEKWYFQHENRLKYKEGLLWGTAMGAFGACFALRKSHFHSIPPTFLADDLFLSLHTLKQGGKVIFDPEARCYSKTSSTLRESFRRKIRIAAGNFQNLSRFKKLLWPPYQRTALTFISHKVLRWFGPFFLLALLGLSIPLAQRNIFYQGLLFIQCGLFFVPLFEVLLRKIYIQVALLRFISHFYLMNLALLIGFFKYLKGIETNVWEPTKRHQHET